MNNISNDNCNDAPNFSAPPLPPTPPRDASQLAGRKVKKNRKEIGDAAGTPLSLKMGDTQEVPSIAGVFFNLPESTPPPSPLLNRFLQHRDSKILTKGRSNSEIDYKKEDTSANVEKSEEQHRDSKILTKTRSNSELDHRKTETSARIETSESKKSKSIVKTSSSWSQSSPYPISIPTDSNSNDLLSSFNDLPFTPPRAQSVLAKNFKAEDLSRLQAHYQKNAKGEERKPSLISNIEALKILFNNLLDKVEFADIHQKIVEVMQLSQFPGNLEEFSQRLKDDSRVFQPNLKRSFEELTQFLAKDPTFAYPNLKELLRNYVNLLQHIDQITKFIEQSIKTDEALWRIFFDMIYTRCGEDKQGMNKPLLIEVLTEGLIRIPRRQLLACEDKLIDIVEININSEYGKRICAVVHLYIEKARSDDFFAFFLEFQKKNPEQASAILLCYPWYTNETPEKLIKKICQRALKSPAQASQLLQRACELISSPLFPLSDESISTLWTFCKKFSKQLDDALKSEDLSRIENIKNKFSALQNALWRKKRVENISSDKRVLYATLSIEGSIKSFCQKALESPVQQASQLLDKAYEISSLSHTLSYSSLLELEQFLKQISESLAKDFEEAENKNLSDVLQDEDLYRKQKIKAGISRLLEVVTKQASARKNSFYFFQKIEAMLNQTKKIDSKKMTKFAQKLAMELKTIEAKYLGQISATAIKAHLSNKSQASPITAYIDYSDTLSYLVASRILHSADLRMSARWVEFFIKLMGECIKIGNYNTAFFIRVGFNQAPVLRLKNLKINQEDEETQDMMESLFTPARNFDNYRKSSEAFEKNNPETCIIPVFSLYLQSLTFTLEGNSAYLPDHKLNPDRIDLVAKQLALLQKYQIATAPLSKELKSETSSYHFHSLLTQIAKSIKQSYGTYSKPFGQAFEELLPDSHRLVPPSMDFEKLLQG